MHTSTDNHNLAPAYRALAWSVAIAIVMYGMAVFFGDYENIRSAVRGVSLISIIAVLGLSLLNYGLRFLRWQGYLGVFGLPLSHAKSLAIYIGGFAFTTTPVKIGETVRSVYLKQQGLSYQRSFAAFFSERFTDVAAVVLLSLLALSTFPQLQGPVIAALLIIPMALVLIHKATPRTYLSDYLAGRQPGRWMLAGQEILGVMGAASLLLRSRYFCSALAIALLAWAAEGLALQIIVASLGGTISLPLAVGIYSVSILAGAISFIPGGLGSTEAAMVLLLTLAGVETSIAISTAIVCRLATLWFAVALGAVFLGILQSAGAATTGSAGKGGE